MKKERRLPRKTLGIFVLFLLIVSIFHIAYNVEIVSRQPSDDWSKNFTLGVTPFYRPVMCNFTDSEIGVLVYPIKDGKGRIGITKVDELGNIIDKYEIYEEKLNFNKAFTIDVIFEDRFLFWRKYDDNTVYVAEFDKEFKKIVRVEKLFDNANSISVASGNNKLYFALAYLDGKVGVYKFDNYELKEIEAPKELNDILMVNLVSYKNYLYLQTVKELKTSVRKEIWITEYENEKILTSKKVSSVTTNIMSNIKGLTCGTDANYIYSITAMNAEEKGRYRYIIDGFSKENYESFDTLSTTAYQKYTDKSFTSVPKLISSDTNGIHLFTTAYTDLDLFNVSSNALKITLEQNQIKNVELISNTKSWSTKASIIADKDVTHVFWLEPNGFRNGFIIRGATDNKEAFETLAKLRSEDIKLGIFREIPVFSHLFLMLFASQMIRALPAIIWFAIVFWLYDKFEDKPKHALIPGIILSFLCQIMFMFSFYKPQYIRYFPDILTNNILIYVLPAIITLISYLVMRVYIRETDKPEYYKQFLIFFAFGYLIINYIYAPFLFIE